MPTLNELKSTINTKLDGFWLHLVARQNVYLFSHGKYFQGILTNNIPSDGTEVLPILSRKPHDQAESWQGAGFALNVPIPMSLAIDTYFDGINYGWVARVFVKYGGKTYSRARAVGALADIYTYNWQEIEG